MNEYDNIVLEISDLEIFKVAREVLIKNLTTKHRLKYLKWAVEVLCIFILNFFDYLIFPIRIFYFLFVISIFPTVIAIPLLLFNYFVKDTISQDELSKMKPSLSEFEQYLIEFEHAVEIYKKSFHGLHIPRQYHSTFEL